MASSYFVCHANTLDETERVVPKSFRAIKRPRYHNHFLFGPHGEIPSSKTSFLPSNSYVEVQFRT